MSDILEKLDKGTRNPSLSLVTPLPDSVHVRKIIKAGFFNWYLKLENDKGNLEIKFENFMKQNKSYS